MDECIQKTKNKDKQNVRLHTKVFEISHKQNSSSKWLRKCQMIEIDDDPEEDEEDFDDMDKQNIPVTAIASSAPSQDLPSQPMYIANTVPTLYSPQNSPVIHTSYQSQPIISPHSPTSDVKPILTSPSSTLSEVRLSPKPQYSQSPLLTQIQSCTLPTQQPFYASTSPTNKGYPTPQLQSQISYNFLPNFSVPHSLQNTSSETIPSQTTTPPERWTKKQTDTLISLWKEYYEDLLDPLKSREIWKNIAEKVSKVGTLKDWSKCKSKIKNLKHYYVRLRDASSKTGESAAKSYKYYDDFDSVLSSRSASHLPMQKQAGVTKNLPVSFTLSSTAPVSSTTPALPSDPVHTRQVEDISDDCSQENTTNKTIVRDDKSGNPKRYWKFDELLELQKTQMKSIEDARKESNEMLQSMFKVMIEMEERQAEKQREHDEKERQRDRNFFLQVAQMVKD